MFKKVIFPFLLLLTGLISALFAQQSKIVYLSGTGFDQTEKWDFYCSDGMNSGVWTTIEVPSCWEQQGFGKYNYGQVAFEERMKEQGRYRYHFDVDKGWKGQAIRLVFEGVMTDARVLVNGKQAGEIHQGAFYEFSYDISGLLKYGKENMLEVEVKKFSDNLSVSQAERKSDYWVFGGIFRPVYLEVSPAEHMERVAVDARADGIFRSDVYSSGLRNAAMLEVAILDASGSQIEVFETTVDSEKELYRLEGSVDHPDTWSPEFPHLYNAEFRLKDKTGTVIHRLTEKFGFRTVEIRAQDGIYVNGTRIKFKGVCRHSFHPDHGRTSSEALSIEVVNLLKDMNMNAVRMSHYPPDKHFLDACDSLGLFVLDELAGWAAPSYDSVVGRKLLREMIARDVNHPSIVIWDNGNEGGWNTAYDKDFKELDIQQREVIHPWAVHEKINTAHYINYDYLAMDNFAPRKIFFPTEFLHGLYDGGHGAGLEDYWLRMWEHPLSAGGFLWVFADEAIRRTDTGELDSDGNHAPDGILGPYHEKEGSFYAIREIWSPVHFEKRYITPGFNGIFRIENRFHYTSLDKCTFSYNWISLPGPDQDVGEKIFSSGVPDTDPLLPGQNGFLSVPLPNGWDNTDVLKVEAHDPWGRLIHSWTWPVKSPIESSPALLGSSGDPEGILVSENENKIILESGTVALELNKSNGLLSSVSVDGIRLQLSRGPIFWSDSLEVLSVKHFNRKASHHVKVHYEDDCTLEWVMHPGGMVDMNLEYQPAAPTGNSWGGYLPYTGASFSFPENQLKSVKYMGNGPYRVWKNRMAGVNFSVWEKTYNNAITGHSGFDYPEFKGYYSKLYWAVISDKEEHSFTVYSRNEDIFLRLFTPEEAPVPAKTHLEHPAGDISFMNGIPAIGTKFTPAEKLGPQSMPYPYAQRRVEDGSLKIELTFDFK